MNKESCSQSGMNDKKAPQVFFCLFETPVEIVIQFVDKGFSVCCRLQGPQVSFLKAITSYKVFEVWFIYRSERVGFNSATEASEKKKNKHSHRNCWGKWNATK